MRQQYIAKELRVSDQNRGYLVATFAAEKVDVLVDYDEGLFKDLG